MSEKEELRKEVFFRSKYTDESLLKSKSEKICSLIEKHPKFYLAKNIALYYPLKGEVDVIPIIKKYYITKNILLPVIINDNIKLKLYTGEKKLARGALGIKEPEGEIWDQISTLDLIIVPGIAYDLSGNRLGRGKGYYDRFLSTIMAYKIGICFDFQIFESIPMQPHDSKVDEVIFA